ncbi:hypothetical protein DFP72DRAFT_866521 [Ephemerocybe angulata]|uniref:BTB domain-containing protein n=1 Tax=Ephemerocybe angulata TaxID=980116 RepID=A0A8H6IKW1_9AGAR|nr:hypothetical protein DFP72DRAFT_866521 [Tulosesus angulatus]
MTVSAIRPVDIQSHLYASFLQGHTADIVLRISGRWKALYRLHRVVLIQADFFRSLFTAGFAESSQQSRPRNRGVEEIHITFDDSNITRAAFEICISRLYGGGPPLHILRSLIPTVAQPLSTSLIALHDGEAIPDGHHPATPRLLLSVLATAIYLCIPTVASQALSLIFKTLGPHTVMPYLNFALGKSIDSTRPVFTDPEAAVGLEHVAEILEDDPDSGSSVSIADGDFSYIPVQPSLSGLRQGEGSDAAFQEILSDDDQSDAGHAPSFHNYGPISDKIGEACACWLVRWAKDMLDTEMRTEDSAPTNEGSQTVDPPVIWRRGGLDPAWVNAIVSADTLFVRSERERYDFARSIVELRRRDGVTDSEEQEWKKMFSEAIYYENMGMEDIIAISHDKSEITSRSFVPISTQTALWNQSMLRHRISARPKPPSPATAQGLPSPPARDKELGISLSTAELGLAPESKDSLTSSLEQKLHYPVPGDSSWRMGDNGEESGDPSLKTAISMEDLFTFSHSPCAASARQSSNRSGTRKVATDKDTEICSTESTFFGLKRERYANSECLDKDPTGKRRWTTFPPCRFGVEFWDIDSLKEKSRLYSQTIWYAGSLFNIYLQVVKKKGQTQLGIYLYRQSTVEAIPPSSAPSPAANGCGRSSESLESAESNQSQPLPSSSPVVDRPHMHRGISYASFGSSPPRSPAISSPTFNSRTLILTNSISPPSTPMMMPSISPSVGVVSPSTSLSIPYTSSPVTPQQPYRDPRASISAYFMISCASATGSSQMRFTSAPDLFSVGQSWGWKTSSLRTEEYMEVGESAASAGNRSAVNSLRATVVLGLI